MTRWNIHIGATLAAIALGVTGGAAADPVAEFYSGKTISIVVPFPPGGDYDLRARAIANHMGKHIPGNPSFVVRNMTGGGGLIAVNWLANVAPRDGTAIGALPQAVATAQAVGLEGVSYDVRTFNWLGNTSTSPNVINSWHTTGIKTLEDARERELVLGATSPGAGPHLYPTVMNMFSGTKFRIVTGYRGGADMNTAMERGETGGRGSNSWASWKSTRPHWLAENKIHMIVQIGLERHPDLPDVPLMQETTDDPVGKALMEFLSLDVGISRAYATTPETDPARVGALQKAFAATMKDPGFLAETGKTNMDISPTSAEQARGAAVRIVDTDPKIIELAKKLMKGE